MEKLIEEMKNPHASSGRVFLIFLDSTHHDYSWPKDLSRFHPYEEKVNYFKAALTNQCLEGIKNRYRNSLYFIDSLMGQFMEELGQSSRGKDAVVVITGDHGEEFYEHGHLFHASGLTQQQTHIPLYYRFGSSDWRGKQAPCQMTSHMDIFPTILHYLTGEDLFGKELQGESIFKTQRWPYVVAARFNASRTPFEFFIHNGEQKMIARFNDEKNIFKSKTLRIVSARDKQEETLMHDMISLQEHFGDAFHKLCSP
jgi:membrane-anchored protein YejM (alkaline phosphatase superfamily)